MKKKLVSALLVGLLSLTAVTPTFAAEEVDRGSVEFNGAIKNSNVTPFAVKSVGGGTWNYGVGPGYSGKHAWSDYKHDTLSHSSTAIVGNDSVTRSATKGEWSYADANGWPWETAYTKWETFK